MTRRLPIQRNNAATFIRQVMGETFVNMFGTTIPIEVDAKVCANWGEK
jgi:hypothetical protein